MAWSVDTGAMIADSLNSQFESLAARQGDAVALIYGEREIALAELIAEGRRVASGLAELGIKAGDRVAIWMPNAPAYLALLLACARLGAICVNVNSRFRSTEVGDIIGRSGARLLVFWPGYRGIAFSDILAQVDPAVIAGLDAVVSYATRDDDNGDDDSDDDDSEAAPPPLPDGVRHLAYDELAAAPPMAEDHGGRDVDFAIFTTSGTTSAPKFVLHRQASIIDHALDVAPVFGYDQPDASILLMMPLCGVFGFSQVMAVLLSGAPLVMLPSFDELAAARAIRRYQVTQCNAGDDMIERLLAVYDEPVPFPSLRFMCFGAFNSPPEVTAARGAERGLTLCSVYGMSEVQALYALPPPEWPLAERSKAGGRLISPRAEVRVRDTESGALLPAGETGELELKGPSLMHEYFNNPEATKKGLTEDGFVRTGDLGYLLEGGGFVFLTRMGDIIRLGGFLVSPLEIEAVVEAHPSVSAVQVVAVEHEGRNRPIAFVIAKAGSGESFDEETVYGFCRGRIAKFKVPERFFPIGEFPATTGPNGTKIQKGKLRQMALERLQGGAV